MHKARTLFQSIGFAVEGILYAVKTQRNMRLLAVGTIAVLSAAAVWGVQPVEWLLLCGAMAALLFAELMNTAMEIFADHVTGGGHRTQVKHMKDVAAGAVLVTAINATVVTAIILLPYALERF